MMLNVEEDLRKKLMVMPEVDLFDPETDDVEPIPIVNPGLTGVERIKLKADAAKRKFLKEYDSEYLANIEYNRALKYYAVVFSLAVDEEPAYKVNGQEQVEMYIENKLGSKYNSVYEDLAIEIIDSLNLKLADITEEDDEEEIEIESEPELDLTNELVNPI